MVFVVCTCPDALDWNSKGDNCPWQYPHYTGNPNRGCWELVPQGKGLVNLTHLCRNWGLVKENDKGWLSWETEETYLGV